MKSKTILFIHGMYMTPICWENWIKYFQNKGYQCHAPAWPGRDLPVETLRKQHPDPRVGKLTFTSVLEHYTKVINGLNEKPILIGHSMGGLAVQLLMDKNLAAAGVAINTAAPMGVFTMKWSFLKANWPHITPFVSQSSPIEMSFERFQYAFANTMPLTEQRTGYERYIVPESRRIPRESLTSKVDFKKPHAPLLLVAGAVDHIIPASLNKSNYAKYKHAESKTDYKEFEGRNHFILGQKNWEEVADYTLAWLDKATR